MVKTKPTSNPTARFTSSWDKQIRPTCRKTIKHERLAVPPRPYGMGQTAHQPPTYVNGEERIGKNPPEESNINMYRSKKPLRQAPQNKRKRFAGHRIRQREGGSKTTVFCSLRKNPKANGLRAGGFTGSGPDVDGASDVTMGQGGGAIP